MLNATASPAATLTEAKDAVRMQLESLISQCYREIRNLDSFDDARMLVATSDLQFHIDYVMEAADDLETAISAVEAEELAAEEAEEEARWAAQEARWAAEENN